MTVAQSASLQAAVGTAIANALTAADETIEIFDHVPVETPFEHIRLHGFEIRDESYKDTELGRHSFMVMFIRRGSSAPGAAGFQRGNSRVQHVLGICHEALKDLRHGRGRMEFLAMDIEPGEGGMHHQGYLRYQIRL